MFIRPNDISRRLRALTRDELREVSECLGTAIGDAVCVGILSEVGQRLFTLREIEENKLDRVREARLISPNDVELMFQESSHEDTVDYLSGLLASEYMRSGCEPVIGENYIIVGKGFLVYQRPNTDSNPEEETMERFFVSARTQVGSCGLPN